MSLGRPRIYGLDILRATAILLVLVVHGIYFFTQSWDNFQIVKFVPDGVSIFFVLSGFLIGNIIIKTFQKNGLRFQDLLNFWIRRWFRTLPAYYFVLAAVIGYSFLLNNTNRPTWGYLKYVFFLQAFNSGSFKIYQESWSLCVEEFFYLLIPAFLFISIRYINLAAKKMFVFCIFFIIISITLFTVYKINFYHITTNEEWDTYVRKTVFTRLSSIMYGFLGAYIMCYHQKVWRYRTLFFVTGLCLFLFLSIRSAFGIGPFFNYEQLSLESIATLLLIPKLVSVKNGKGLLYKGLTYISTTSYAIYLVNYTPFYLLLLHLNSVVNINSLRFAFIRLGLFLIWSFGAGYLIYKLIEKPMMRKRELYSKKELAE